VRARLVERLGGRQLEGSPELAATVRAYSRIRSSDGRDPECSGLDSPAPIRTVVKFDFAGVGDKLT
jgi:hypothetical protein